MADTRIGIETITSINSAAAVDMDSMEMVVGLSASPASGSAPVGSIVWRCCLLTGPPEAHNSVEVHSWGRRVSSRRRIVRIVARRKG